MFNIELNITDEVKASMTDEEIVLVNKWLDDCAVILKKEMAGVIMDLETYGTGIMKDGKHINITDVMK